MARPQTSIFCSSSSLADVLEIPEEVRSWPQAASISFPLFFLTTAGIPVDEKISHVEDGAPMVSR